MTHANPTRRAALALSAGAIAAATVTPAFAARDTAVEAFVLASVNEAMAALGNTRQSAAQRQQEFARLMRRFADVPRIANHVLGRYGRAMQADPAMWRRWVSVFTEYSFVVYEDQFSQFRADTFRVIGSQVRREGADVIVEAQITPRGASRPQRVDWRMLRGRDGAWRVLDIRTLFDGNEVWLGDRQQADFLSYLDRNGRNLQGLVDEVVRQTGLIRTRINSRT